MKPDKTTVYDLFYNQRQFAVPLYQRPYVWTLEAQWQPLWQDIDDKAVCGGGVHRPELYVRGLAFAGTGNFTDTSGAK